jgi:hemerythrin-like domain-containing protein
MKATEILMDEHRVIERVLTVLERVVGRMDRGEEVRPGLFLDAADFIQNFADGSHHNKEEGVLFGAMVEAGVPRHGPVVVMLSEHEQARALTRAMREAAERWEAGDEEARPQVSRAARDYAALLRQHIAKEDQILFPMAAQAIPSSEHERLVTEFANVEAEDVRAGIYEKYFALADALEREVEG